MVRDPFARADRPDPQRVLDALEDPDGRRLLLAAGQPRTARELAERGDMALSTTYRKLRRLSDASLVRERLQVAGGGRHTTRYVVDVASIRLALDEVRELQVAITRPVRAADEQLAKLWSAVRQES